MNAATLDDLRPRAPDRLSRGALLAIVAHAGLLVALTLGVSWRSSEPAGVEAELWAAVPQIAAPRAVAPPEPTPAPKPEPPKPAPRAEPPPPAPSRDAEIAREKREQQKLEKQRTDAAREERERAAEAKRAAEAQKKAEADRLARAEAERRKRAEAESAARIEAQRAENLKRIQGDASASGAPDSSGTAAQSAGPSASYAGRIKARIKPNIVFTEELAGNPLASVELRVAPDGTITARRLVTSSGSPTWDDAVLRAIDKTAVLPRDTDGRVPALMVIDFKPRDF
jgi:colicin import membrane protein